MEELCGENNIIVICGDILEVYFEVEGLDVEAVQRVLFKSDTAQICAELPYSNLEKAYCLRLSSETTKDFKPSFGSYDLTVELINGNIITVAHNCGFAILKKRNSQSEEK